MRSSRKRASTTSAEEGARPTKKTCRVTQLKNDDIDAAESTGSKGVVLGTDTNKIIKLDSPSSFDDFDPEKAWEQYEREGLLVVEVPTLQGFLRVIFMKTAPNMSETAIAEQNVQQTTQSATPSMVVVQAIHCDSN